MITKRCFRCKKIKALALFYKHPAMPDGRTNKCKLCTKKEASQKYQDPDVRKRIRLYEEKRRKDPYRKAKQIEYQQARRLRSPVKNIARRKVFQAIKQGRLIKKPCEVCGNPKVEAHHTDYRMYLKVMWLCRKHHWEIENKKGL